MQVEEGRLAYGRREWSRARDALAGADAESTLAAEDLWRLSVASYLVGDEDAFVDALERAHRLARETGDEAAAFRSAFWIGMHLGDRGMGAQAGGWFGRAGRIVEGHEEMSVERAYLLLPQALQRFGAGDHEGSCELGREAAAVGERAGERDLFALGVLLQGRGRIEQGRVEEGLRLLDEAMVAVATDELSPTVTGLVYCAVIGACRKVYALGRAQEWTAALRDWCAGQPDMVAYIGECRVYRSELLQMHGAWGEALEEARRAARVTGGDGATVAGLACYQQGELHRLRGDLDQAEAAFADASRAGRVPQPGLALLRLAQGQGDVAMAMLRRSLAETPSPLGRLRLLPAQVEVSLATGDQDTARAACEELASIAAAYPSPVLGAMAGAARGAVGLAAGEAESALPELREAWRGWHALDAPWEAARTRVRIGLACRHLGDEDGARLELEDARREFSRLGAGPDVERVDALLRRRTSPPRPHGLTPREMEVIGLVATGKTNRAIGRELFISEKTVARHLSNIFAKLGISSRSAATAFAYEHGLLAGKDAD
ncbi:MAG TPA: LuxR C-terminal-related transcriptional regulator [Longimicrobiales bacterium]|nr:LuxR C-terminal-related transcriptional regulator [Longimicrobiales bacterium]